MSSSLDPQMPYIQVHRSVGPRAAQLAVAIGVTYQHARGSLDVFWESLADRRILAKAVIGPGGQPELVLPTAELTTRLRLAFGQPVDFELLVHAGILEPRETGWRVRGMSRYLIAEATRLAKKGAGAPGSTPTAPAPAPQGSPVAPGCHPGPTPPPPGSDPTEVRGERREVRDETKKATTIAPPSPGEGFFVWAQGTRAAKRGLVREREPKGLSTWLSVALSEVSGDTKRLEAGYLAYLDDQYWSTQGWPWRGWVSQWERHVPAAAPPSPSEPADPLERAWKGRLDDLRGRGHAYVAEQLKDLRPTETAGDELIVGVSDPFYVGWVQEHYGRLLPGVRFMHQVKAGAS